jgi:hypothetical protein
MLAGRTYIDGCFKLNLGLSFYLSRTIPGKGDAPPILLDDNNSQ